VVPCTSETALPTARTPELEVTTEAVFRVINPPVNVVAPVVVNAPVTSVVPEVKVIPFKVVLVPPSSAPVNVPFPFNTATPPD
jgi:hypothetical protein